MQTKQFFLFTTVFTWAILIGGIMYSHIVYFPAYLSSLPESNKLITGPYGLKDENFWMFVHPFTLLFTSTCLVMHWRQTAKRKLIGGAAIIYAIILVATALYFVPGLMEFAGSGESKLTAVELYTKAETWQQLSWLRGSFMMLGFLFLLAALAKNEANLSLAKNKVLELS